ncbi:uncharacterized protein LOC129602717 [Paramacrobiotus metropolitanus]|uniref:uncharacterized protein LOC129602717 n=1 Tax=Paramacrobiotus metropolitanus TaxID=2943436 RepID=UPI0024462954|nr:uncharacterized protein LOC129602717 [Paramacrobiotus metropolitanus]XP_055357807.1 uncharacterized protein LOC129602717 [Paramacrobiotus metropolitanus]XP_055357808.1 uncharacterized protein LOC129602717 [Paramacrobiotus metropolitanus]
MDLTHFFAIVYAVFPTVNCLLYGSNDSLGPVQEKLVFRSEEIQLIQANDTIDDSANEIPMQMTDGSLFIEDSTAKDCGVGLNETMTVNLDDQYCPLPKGTPMVNIGGDSGLPVEYFVIGMHPVFSFPDSSDGTLTLQQPINATASYNVSVAVTSICGTYVLVTVVINVKCNPTGPTTQLPVSATDSPATVHGKSFSPDCPPRLVSPSDGTLVVNCVTLESDPNIRYIPPDHIVGKLIMKGAKNYSFFLRSRSNFVVFNNGSVAMGGYLAGDGFKSVLSLNITDSLGDCAESLLVDVSVLVDCYPERQRDILPAFDHSSTEVSSENRVSSESTTPSTTASMPDGVLMSPSEHVDPTPPMAQTPLYILLGIPPGVDI